MRIAIVEDDRGDAELLRSCLKDWSSERGIVLVPPPTLFFSGEALLEKFAPDQYDLIFLDVLMEGVNGMETARRIRAQDSRCRLIFITSSPDFAVESYEVSAAYYLLKPYSYEKLRDALDRSQAQRLEQGQYIDLHGREGKQRLYLHQIAYTEYAGRRICVHGGSGSVSYVPMSQGEFSARLLDYPYFCDCMRGILVNLEYVDKLLPDRFLLKDGQEIPISRLKYHEVREKFLQFTYDRVRGGET